MAATRNISISMVDLDITRTFISMLRDSHASFAERHFRSKYIRLSISTSIQEKDLTNATSATAPRLSGNVQATSGILKTNMVSLVKVSRI